MAGAAMLGVLDNALSRLYPPLHPEEPEKTGAEGRATYYDGAGVLLAASM